MAYQSSLTGQQVEESLNYIQAKKISIDEVLANYKAIDNLPIGTILREGLNKNIFGENWIPCDGRDLVGIIQNTTPKLPEFTKITNSVPDYHEIDSYQAIEFKGIIVVLNYSSGGGEGYLYWSDNRGTTWNDLSYRFTASDQILSVVNDRLFAFDGTDVYSTSDGKSWIKGSCSSYFYTYYDIAYLNGVYLLLQSSDSTCMYSDDGINFKECTNSSDMSFLYTNDKIAIAGNDSSTPAMYNEGTSEWKNIFIDRVIDNNNANESIFYYLNGKFYLICDAYPNKLLVSDDGKNYASTDYPKGLPSLDNLDTFSSYFNGKYVVIRDYNTDGKYYRSKDGINFEEITSTLKNVNNWAGLFVESGLGTFKQSIDFVEIQSMSLPIKQKPAYYKDQNQLVCVDKTGVYTAKFNTVIPNLPNHYIKIK